MDKSSNDFLSSIVSSLGIDSESPFMRIARGWNGFVGDELADKSEPVELKDGCLRVACRSSASLALFTMKKCDIIEAINNAVPDAVKTIRAFARA